MKTVKVLLKESVKDLGRFGEVVRVRPGYARNYLIPYRLAIEATPDNVKAIERRRVRYEAEVAAREVQIAERIEALGRVQLMTKERADETGTLYGSVSTGVVVKLLAEAGHVVAERDVRLDEPIKSVGVHEIPIHIHGEHYAGVQLVVEALT